MEINESAVPSEQPRDPVLVVANDFVQEGKQELANPQTKDKGVGKIVVGETVKALKQALEDPRKEINMEKFIETLRSDFGGSIEIPDFIIEPIVLSSEQESILKSDPTFMKTFNNTSFFPQGLRKITLDAFNGVVPALFEYRQRVKQP